MRWLLLLLVACGPATAPARATLPQPMPSDEAERHAVLRDLGQRLYAHLADGEPRAVLFDDAALGTLLEPEAATRARAVRVAPLHVHADRLALLRQAEPSSLCIQGGSQAGEGDPPFALKGPAWVFERALVAGQRPGGQRVALWVEGTFVLSDSGFGAIALRRVEDPRWEHSDLELATCDVRVELGTPQDVVVVTE